MRAETFRPPLTTFSKHSNRSRGRSRPTPILHIPKPTNSVQISQDPSSPKVTCIGQVKSESGGAALNRRRLINKALFRGKFSSRFYNRSRGFGRLFCKWALLFRSNYCRKVDAVEDCFRAHSGKREKAADERESSGGGIREIGIEFVGDCSFPSKNGLNLYRSTSLGGRFLAENGEKTGDLQKPIVENGGDSRIVEECSRKFDDEDLKGAVGSTVHPLVLTRCESEPSGREEMLLRRFAY